MATAKKVCKKCGGTIHGDECKLCELFASSSPPPAAQSGLWESWGQLGALAVSPKQVAEANARLKRHGIVGAYDPTGNIHVPDRANRKKLLRLEGMHDNNGGYGD
jgi:hypothetical protein